MTDCIGSPATHYISFMSGYRRKKFMIAFFLTFFQDPVSNNFVDRINRLLL